MKILTRHSLLLIIAGLTLCALPACGPTDPSEENNATTENNSTTDKDQGGETTDDMGGETTEDDMGGETTEDDMGGETTEDDMGGETTDDMGGELTECQTRALYEGQMGNTNPAKGGGGSFVIGDGAYEADAGLSLVNESVSAALTDGTITEDDEDTMDVSEDELVFADGEELVITGAVVTSTAYERKDDAGNFSLAARLTFQDQKVGVLAFIDGITMDKDGNAIVVKVGDKLNFKVKAVRGFGGDTPQISQIVEVEKVGENVDVGVIEKTGSALTVEEYQKLVRVHGVVTSAEGAACGGSSFCFDIEHEGQTTTLRISDNISRLPMNGDCITYVGPASSFPGPLADSVTMQLDAVNFTWYRGPFAE